MPYRLGLVEGLGKLQLYSLPLNRLTPTMANTRKNSEQTMTRLPRAGSARSRALTTSLSPSFLLIMRRGRRPLKALRALSDLSLEDWDSKSRMKSVRETVTMQKSSIFQPSESYVSPFGTLSKHTSIAIILINISMTNIIVKHLSSCTRIRLSWLFGSDYGVFRMIVIELQMIMKRMKLLNQALSLICTHFILTQDPSSNKKSELLAILFRINIVIVLSTFSTYIFRLSYLV